MMAASDYNASHVLLHWWLHPTALVAASYYMVAIIAIVPAACYCNVN
jgi:hypothetical protein